MSYPSLEYQKIPRTSSSCISNSTTCCISESGLKPTLCLRLTRVLRGACSTNFPSLTENDEVAVNSSGNMVMNYTRERCLLVVTRLSIHQMLLSTKVFEGRMVYFALLVAEKRVSAWWETSTLDDVSFGRKR